MKFLITGGLGFVGSHLIDSLLQKKHKVVILTKSKKKFSNIINNSKKINLELVDITKFKKLEESIEKNKPDQIIHLAGQTSHSKSFEDPLNDIDVNAKATLVILEKLRKMEKNCKFILGSTFAVTGKPKNLPVNEESSNNPRSLYGANRLLSEHYCKIYHELYGLDTKIFRITNCYGPREQIVSNKNAVNYLIHEAFLGNKITIYQNGQFFRDIIYISDVISGINKIIQRGKSGNLYWISSGKKTWFYQFGKLLEKQSTAHVEFIKPSKFYSTVDVGNFVVNNSKLKKLGWTPKISLDEGISLTLKFFQKY